MNILTFDLEDWYQLAHRRVTGELPPARDTLFRQVDSVMELLDQAQTRATFFTLGIVAECFPQLIRRIAAQGHEIASHGYAHLRVFGLSRQEFVDDCCRARDVLKDIVGKPISGYRAAEFSINGSVLWALDALAACGFAYDSSIFPIHHRLYGVPGFAPHPARYRLPSGLRITELPLATVPFAGLRAPVAGGGYFRVLPLWALRRAVIEHEARRVPMTTYFHPYEFDPVPLNLFQVLPRDGWTQRLSVQWLNWQQNLGRAGVTSKLAALLHEFKFTSCQEYLDAAHFTEDRNLLPAARAAI